MYEIEQGVPVPQSGSCRTRPAKYPFRQLSVGESFFVPLSDGQSTTRLQRTLASCAARQKVKVQTRVMEDGVRVWRKE